MTFYDKYKRVELSPQAYIQDASIMLSDQTLFYYYINQISYTWYDFCINMKLYFEESEWQRFNLTRWQIINISKMISSNLTLFLSECLRKMCIDMIAIKQKLNSAYHDSIHLRENIIRVCRNHFALTYDLNNVSLNVFDLINSLHISVMNYEAIRKSS